MVDAEDEMRAKEKPACFKSVDTGTVETIACDQGLALGKSREKLETIT